MVIRLLAASLLLSLSSQVAAETWNVPSEIPTIQAAIDTSAQKDTVAVGPGTYHERLAIIDKNICLLGTAGPQNTFLSGALLSGDSLSILFIGDGVDTTTLISGFTFENNGADSARWTLGGAISCFSFDASPKIRNNVFRSNYAETGGAISVIFSSPGPIIENNVFTNNSANAGGAISIEFADGATIVDNTFEQNAALTTPNLIGVGGAIHIQVWTSATVEIRSNIIYRNEAGWAAITLEGGGAIIDGNTFAFNEATHDVDHRSGGIRVFGSGSSAVITNNIVAFSGNGWGISVLGSPAGSPSITMDCNDFWQNALGNYFWGSVTPSPGPNDFYADPLFCDSFSGVLPLAVGSPCLPENSGSCGLVGALGVGCGPVPVSLSYFTVERIAHAVILSWEMTEATDHSGFHVYRQQPGAERERLTDHLLTGQTEYEFIDPTPPREGADYWLAEISRTGETTWHGPAELPPASLPARLTLGPGVPNPFRAQTQITYSIPGSQHVALVIYDLQGRRIATLVNEEQDPGEYTVSWDGRMDTGMAASGLYFLRLRAGKATKTQKLMFVR